MSVYTTEAIQSNTFSTTSEVVENEQAPIFLDPNYTCIYLWYDQTKLL